MIVSFGLGHNDPAVPDGLYTLDLRAELSDPARMSEELRRSNGLDPRVQQVVWSTPGAQDLYEQLLFLARANPAAVLRVACAGGRHRSVAFAERIGAETGHEVRHLHIDRPRILRAGS